MLQFQCPRCQVLIRVNDSAMGQRGTCPKCHQSLLVPSLVPVTQQESDCEPTQAVSGNPEEQQAVDNLFSAIHKSEEFTSEDSIYRTTVRSRGSNRTTFLTGLFFLLIAAGGATAYYYLTQPLMQGEFIAQLMPANAIKPTLLTRKAIQQPELFEAFWLKHPDKKININSRLLEVSVLAQKRGLEFRLYPGSENDLYRVDLLKNQPLYDFYIKESSHLDKKRKKILTEASGDFLKQMINEAKGLKRNSRLLIEFRDRMVLSAMVKGLGLRLTAIVDGKQYPCVYQDKDDKLYFSLPKETTRFIIRETELAGKKSIFPKSLRFTVTCSEAKKTSQDNAQEPMITDQSKQDDSDQDAKSESKAEGESEADSKKKTVDEEEGNQEKESPKTEPQSNSEESKPAPNS